MTHEVAAMLRMSSAAVRDLVAEGRLKAVRVRPRGRLLFDPADVEQAAARSPSVRGRGRRRRVSHGGRGHKLA